MEVKINTKAELLYQTPAKVQLSSTVLEPRGSLTPPNFRELWEYRELLYLLMWRDLKVRYKQTFLGVVWVIMQPLLTTLIFTIFLGKLARVPTEKVPYPLFAYAGLLPWTFFSGAVSITSNSIVGNAHLITKVYFPRLIVPLAAIGARLIDLAIGFVFLGVLLFHYNVSLTSNLLLLPFLTLLIVLLSFGIGMALSALNVKYRDVGIMLPVLMQLWMFTSPIIYPSGLVPLQWRFIYILNPLVGVIDGFRAALFGGAFDWLAIIISTVLTLTVLASSTYAFQRLEKRFADLV